MSIFENTENLKLLQNLLRPQQRRDADDDSETDDEAEVAKLRNNLNPGNIGPAKSTANEQQEKKDEKDEKEEKEEEKKEKQQPALPKSVGEQPQIKTIEDWQAMQEKEDNELLETRKLPEFKLSYRQAVGTQDVFLQTGNRTNATASCEDLVVVIQLPEEEAATEKMDLSITSTEIDLATPVYRLKMPLPHPINVDCCSAKYETDERRLCLKLRLKREFDFVNF